MKKSLKSLMALILAVIFVFPLSACNTTPEESGSEGQLADPFLFTLDKTQFSATLLNQKPAEDQIAIYTYSYQLDGSPSVVYELEEGRTAVCVRPERTESGTEYSIFAVVEETGASCPIARNGFLVTIPTEQLDGLRVRYGQLVGVEDDTILGTQENTKQGSFYPDSDYSNALIRRIDLKDPYDEIVSDGIYFISAEYSKKGNTVPEGSVILTLSKATSLSYRIEGKETGNQVIAGTDQLVFVGDYNISYGKEFCSVGQKIFVNKLDEVSSYKDAGFILNDTVYQISEENVNVSSIEENGVYLYDQSCEGVASAKTDLERVDVVIINEMVAYIGEKNARIMLPQAGGYAITFAGDSCAVAEQLQVGDSVTSIKLDSTQLSGKTVMINGNLYNYDKKNEARVPEGVVVLYTPEFGTTTGTNSYGFEVSVSNGVVKEIATGKGNMEIPSDGYVLSFHQSAEQYDTAKNSIRVGDEASVQSSSNYTLYTLDVTQVNGARYTDYLVVYQGVASTKTNIYGYEITVDQNHTMISESYSGDSAVPAGGMVLSGHGSAKEMLEDAFSYGATAIFRQDEMKVYLIHTPETYLIDTATRVDDMSSSLAEAKQQLKCLEYDSLDEQVESAETLLSEAKAAFSSGEYQTAFDNMEQIEAIEDAIRFAMIESSAVENRSVWYRSTEKSDEEVRATVEKMKLLNITALYVETWYDGRFLGYSDNELIMHTTLNGDYDALEGFVRICHENGIEVHAWVEDFFIGTVEAQESANQKLASHFEGRWLMDSTGKNTYYYSESSTNFIFLNPYDREARDLILGLYEEIITKYDVDGIHLDYIRFPEKNGNATFGYNEDIVAAWQKENHTTCDPAKLVSGELMDSWNLFRQNIITSFVGEVSEMIENVNSDVWLSAAVYPGIPSVKNDIFQDCEAWVKLGYVDELYSMSYGVDNEYVSSNAAAFAELTGDDCFYSTGIMAFGETPETSFALQMTEVTEAGADGVAIFALASITPVTYQYAITTGAFREEAIRVNRYSETVAAQIHYIYKKADIVYSSYAGLTEDDLTKMRNLLDPILEKAEQFDLENATKSQKQQYCQETIDALQSIRTDFDELFGSAEQGRIALKDIDRLIHWMTACKNRA